MKMNNLKEQVELFFVNPTLLAQSKTPILGHFTSKNKIPDYSKMRLTVSVKNNEIQNIYLDEKSLIISNRNEYQFYTDPELQFLNDSSLSNLMTSEKLECYTSLFNPSEVIAQIMLIEVEPLITGLNSYIFFGFANSNNEMVMNNHTKVFYTENDEIKYGGQAPHTMGSHIPTAMQNNFAFGFGRNLKLNAISPKKYLDGNRKYMKMISDPKEKNNPYIKKVFANNGFNYIQFLEVMNNLLKEKNMDYRPFWLIKEEDSIHNEIFNEAFNKSVIA